MGATNNKLNLKAVAAKVGSVPSARKGGTGKKDTDALSFFGGFKEVAELVLKFPEVTADDLQENIGRLYLKKTILTNALGRRELSETKNVDCFRLTGDYEFKYVGTADNLSDPMQALSAREFEIFRMLVDGVELNRIATTLNISLKTVANYQTSIKQKLEINTPVEMVRLAIRCGLIEG